MNIFDYIEEYDGDEVMSGKPNTFKMKKQPKNWSDDGRTKKGTKPKGKRQINPYKNMKQADI